MVSIVKLQYYYALNVTDPGAQALRFKIYDHANTQWIQLTEHTDDATPNTIVVNLTDTFNTYPGINQTDVIICFEYDDIDASWGYGAGIGDMKIWAEAVNENCTDAIPISVAPFNSGCANPITANNIGAQDSTSQNGTPACGGFNGGDIWYSFVAPNSGGIKITLPNGSQDWSSMSLALYNNCGETTEITCSNTKTEEVIEDLVPGNTYLLRLWDFNNNDFGDIDFCIEENNTPPSNDEANHAIPLVVEPAGTGCVNPTIMYNTFATDSSPINGTPVCGNYAGGDLWYYFTVPANGMIKIIRTHEGNWGHVSYAIYDMPTDTSEILCGTLFTGDTEIVITGLTPGEEEGLRVWEWGNDDFGAEGICLEKVDSSGIADTVIEGFSMYPNPSGNNLTIKAQNTLESIYIYNMLGQEVFVSTPNSVQAQLDISSLQTGAYVVKVKSGNQIGAYSLIKK